MNKEVKLRKLYSQLDALENAIKHIYITDVNNVWKYSSFKNFAQKYNIIATKAAQYLDADDKDMFVNVNEKVGSFYLMLIT